MILGSPAGCSQPSAQSSDGLAFMSLQAVCCTLVLRHFHWKVFMVTETSLGMPILKVTLGVWSRLGHKS